MEIEKENASDILEENKDTEDNSSKDTAKERTKKQFMLFKWIGIAGSIMMIFIVPSILGIALIGISLYYLSRIVNDRKVFLLYVYYISGVISSVVMSFALNIFAPTISQDSHIAIYIFDVLVSILFFMDGLLFWKYTSSRLFATGTLLILTGAFFNIIGIGIVISWIGWFLIALSYMFVNINEVKTHGEAGGV